MAVNNMGNLQMYCISIESCHFSFIKNLDYIPVGLGDKNFSEGWIRDNTEHNISHKNKYYGEYTFHYWLWKNYIDKLDDKWIGFCQYRKFWTLNNYDNTKIIELKSRNGGKMIENLAIKNKLFYKSLNCETNKSDHFDQFGHINVPIKKLEEFIKDSYGS